MMTPLTGSELEEGRNKQVSLVTTELFERWAAFGMKKKFRFSDEWV